MSSLLHTYPPLDYSFLQLTSIQQLLEVQPNKEDVMSGTNGNTQNNKIQSPKSNNNKAAATKDDSASKLPEVIRALQLVRAEKNGTSIESKNQQQQKHDATTTLNRPLEVTNGIKMSCNQLRSLNGLNEILSRVMEDAFHTLKWLDLSYNQLTTLYHTSASQHATTANASKRASLHGFSSPGSHNQTSSPTNSNETSATNHITSTTAATTSPLTAFQALTVIYLQGNQLHDLKHTCALLSKFSNLQKLQLHGNPLYDPKLNGGGVEKPRAYIIGAIPQLRSLDSVTITNEERDASVMYYHSLMVKTKRRGAKSRKH